MLALWWSDGRFDTQAWDLSASEDFSQRHPHYADTLKGVNVKLFVEPVIDWWPVLSSPYVSWDWLQPPTDPAWINGTANGQMYSLADYLSFFLLSVNVYCRTLRRVYLSLMAVKVKQLIGRMSKLILSSRHIVSNREILFNLTFRKNRPL